MILYERPLSMMSSTSDILVLLLLCCIPIRQKTSYPMVYIKNWTDFETVSGRQHHPYGYAQVQYVLTHGHVGRNGSLRAIA